MKQIFSLIIAVLVSLTLVSCVVVVRRNAEDKTDRGSKDGGAKKVIIIEKKDEGKK